MDHPEKRHHVFLAAPNIITTSSELKDGCRHFLLIAEETQLVPVQGIAVRAWGFNGSVPGPLLVTNEGDPVVVTVENRLREDMAMHWRGIPMSNELSGNPLTGTGQVIPPGETMTYSFTPATPGTYMYHAELPRPRQVHMGLAGMMIVLPAVNEAVNRDYSLLFQGWVLQRSKVVPGLTQDQMNWLSHRVVKPLYEIYPDRFDYNYFTINGKSFPDTLPLRVKHGERVRIRMGNVSHVPVTIHIHGHRFQVVACDGMDLPQPFWKHTLTVQTGETWDILLEADNPGTWVIQAQQPHCLRNGSQYPGGIVTTLRYTSTP